MKKTYSISENMVARIQRLAETQGTTQSKIIETAVTIYALLNYGDPKNASKITEAINQAAAKGQIDMLDKLFAK